MALAFWPSCTCLGGCWKASARLKGDRRLPLPRHGQGALEDIGELLSRVQMLTRGRPGGDLREDDYHLFPLHPRHIGAQEHGAGHRFQLGAQALVSQPASDNP